MPWLRIPNFLDARRLAHHALVCVTLVAAVTAGGGSSRSAASVQADGTEVSARPATLTGTLAYIAAGDAWTLAADMATVRVTTTGDIGSVRWSPGGRWLLLSRAGRSVAVTPDGSRTIDISGAWLPNDSGVAVATSDGGVDLVDPEAGSTRHLLAGMSDVSYQPVAWSPDGSTLALTRRVLNVKGLPVSEAAWLVQWDGQRLRPLVAEGSTWPRPVSWSPDGRFLAIAHGPAELCVSCRADGERLDIVAADGSRTYTVGTMVRPESLDWAPDSSAVIASIGAGRESYRNKSLSMLNLSTAMRMDLSPQPGTVEIEPDFATDSDAFAFTRGPAIDGPPFTNLDAVHGYPAAPAGRRIWLASVNGAKNGANPVPLAHLADQSEESPRWVGAGSLLFVRWKAAAPGIAPAGQIWLADISGGTQALLVPSFGTAASNVGYYGDLGWATAFAWRP